jgi:hypothetical protein
MTEVDGMTRMKRMKRMKKQVMKKKGYVRGLPVIGGIPQPAWPHRSHLCRTAAGKPTSSPPSYSYYHHRSARPARRGSGGGGGGGSGRGRGTKERDDDEAENKGTARACNRDTMMSDAGVRQYSRQ